MDINFISLQDLLKNKLASGRFKDLEDLEHLQKSVKRLTANFMQVGARTV